MIPLITTVRTIRELATGLSPSAVDASPVLFSYTSTHAEIILSASDEIDAQRIVIIRDDFTRDNFVPDHLAGVRNQVLNRMASLVERAQRHPISLPRAWHQYKHNALVSFFAAPGGDENSSRWIAEMVSGGNTDVIFWQTTTSRTKSALAVFEALGKSLSFDVDSEWLNAFQAAAGIFAESRRIDDPDDDINLASLAHSPTKGWSYYQWLEEISDDQRAFIEAPTDRSIRLRGPAGSGKTLALSLKAVKEALDVRANDAASDSRILIATHSWALAAQIDASISSMGLGSFDEIDVFPLLEIARLLSPGYKDTDPGLKLIGEDSFSGKRDQLYEISELLEEFVETDWITYRLTVNKDLRHRFDSKNVEEKQALTWDLLLEFGSVIGAAAIFPGAGSESKYFQLQRMSWMLPLPSRQDKQLIFALYCRYMDRLEDRSLITSDQVLADFISHLETHAWNRTRKVIGYDLIFVDEFHLFNPIERQVLHYLTRDVLSYPSIFMAVDPRQSPSEAFIGVAAEGTLSSASIADAALDNVDHIELNTVHRFSPQILHLVKHVHHAFPTLELGEEWDIDFSAIESAQADGSVPSLTTSASRNAEETDIYRSVQDLYGGGRIALAIVDIRQWDRFSDLASRINQSTKYHVTTITGRSDIEGLGYRRRGLVVGPAEYLAGLQFETVLVAGLPDLQASNITVNERSRLLSLLYLAISRAEREVRLFVNDDDGGSPEVLVRAVANGFLTKVRGSEV